MDNNIETQNEEFDEIKIETTRTLEAMFHQILNAALVAVGAEAGSLMLVDNKRGLLQIKARLGKPQPNRKVEPVYKIADKGIASTAVKEKRACVCSDIDKDTLFTPSVSGKNFASLLSVPIVFNDKVLAVINADSEKIGYFNEFHLKKLTALADKVSGPMAERIGILDAMATAGVAISRLPSEGGIDKVLKSIARLACQSLGAHVVTIYPYIQEKNEFPVEGVGPTIYPEVHDIKPMKRKVYPGDVPWTIVKERKPGFYADVNSQDFLTGNVDRPGDETRPRFIEREGIKSMAALLLPYMAAENENEEVVGVMFVNYRTHHEFNIDEVSVLATFADYASIAIQNARHEHQRRMEQIRIAESFSANFAHRISNLAATGSIAAQLLRKRISPDDDFAMRQLDKIERETSILMNLAERIASNFKETGKMFALNPVDVTKVIYEEIEVIKKDYNNISITYTFGKNIPTVQSVDFQLRQVLHDIIHNSIEATHSHELPRIEIVTYYDTKNNQVKIQISDNGPGISQEIKDRIFKPGVTTKKDKLGIGLWWCKTFMQASGGDIQLLESKLENGASFVVQIPGTGEKEMEVLDKLPHKDILVVEDEERFRNDLSDMLDGYNYSIVFTDSYLSALNELQITQFSLVMVDIGLTSDPQNKDGLRLLKEMDTFVNKTNAIIITGQGTEQDEKIAKTCECFKKIFYKRKLNVPEFTEFVEKIIRNNKGTI